MKIEERVDKWLEESIRKIRGLMNLNSPLETDIFCLNVVIAVKSYLDSVFLLLEKCLYYPAMANLRIVSDLIVKFLWCLQDKTTGETERRINRWKKKTFRESKQLLEDLGLKSEYAKIIAELDKEIQSIKDNEMPKVTGNGGLFEQIKMVNLFSKLPQDLYPKAYQQFNKAIHIDTDSLNKIGEQLSEGEINNIKIYCLYFTYLVRKMLCYQYGGNDGLIDQEFKEAYN